MFNERKKANVDLLELSFLEKNWKFSCHQTHRSSRAKVPHKKASEVFLVPSSLCLAQAHQGKYVMSSQHIVSLHITRFIIQQIVTMPIYGKEALNICHPYMTDILRYT